MPHLPQRWLARWRQSALWTAYDQRCNFVVSRGELWTKLILIFKQIAVLLWKQFLPQWVYKYVCSMSRVLAKLLSCRRFMLRFAYLPHCVGALLIKNNCAYATHILNTFCCMTQCKSSRFAMLLPWFCHHSSWRALIRWSITICCASARDSDDGNTWCFSNKKQVTSILCTQFSTCFEVVAIFDMVIAHQWGSCGAAAASRHAYAMCLFVCIVCWPEHSL